MRTVIMMAHNNSNVTAIFVRCIFSLFPFTIYNIAIIVLFVAAMIFFCWPFEIYIPNIIQIISNAYVVSLYVSSYTNDLSITNSVSSTHALLLYSQGLQLQKN